MNSPNLAWRNGFLSLLLLMPAIAHASSVRKATDFSYTGDVGYGNEVCVLGAHPALGGNDPLRAIKLTWTPGHVWSGSIALPAGASLSYRFIKRPFAAASWGNPALTQDLTANQSLQVPDHASPPWQGKTVFLRSSWPQATIAYRDLTNAGSWTSAPMRVVGQGRSPTENLFRADGIAASGAEMEFIFTDGSQWLNAPAPPTNTPQGAAPAIPYPYQGLSAPYNFRTSLDVFFVQDQQVFNYIPPATLSAPRFAYWQIHSTVAGIPERWITVRLPRGYDENTWKKYPVVYFHDGQNVFFPGGPYGTWDTDRIADYEIGQGRMRECLIVSIPNGNDLGSNRLNEYLPDGDTIANYGGVGVNYDGRAGSYRQFLLDNVLPTLDYHFRTFGDAANTLVAGSSMGGLVSDFIGLTQGDRFGTVGIFSPAYWAAPNYMGARTVPTTSQRAYVYMGTAESSSGESSSDVYWQGALNAYNSFLRAGRVANRSLLFEGGPGAQHNEPAWSRHLPAFFAFALDPWLEANPLALASFPPHLDLQSFEPASDRVTLRHLALYGFQTLLQSSENLNDWVDQPLAGAENPWDLLETVDASPAAQKRFWRVKTSLP